MQMKSLSWRLSHQSGMIGSERRPPPPADTVDNRGGGGFSYRRPARYNVHARDENYHALSQNKSQRGSVTFRNDGVC